MSNHQTEQERLANCLGLFLRDLAKVAIDDMTAKIWREMTSMQHQIWKSYWGLQGQVSFSCTQCGFPTVFGQSGCESCKPTKPEPESVT